MEAESKIELDRFFGRWIYESGLPRVRYSSAVEGQEVVVRFEQGGEVYDIPVTVTLQYADKAVDHVVLLTAANVEQRFPLTGTLRSVELNDDNFALGTFERR